MSEQLDPHNAVELSVRRRARNRRAMWRVIGWATWVVAMLALLIAWSALMGTS